MANQISTQTVSFNNQSLITIEQNGVHYVAMKPICENIGIQWESQYNRIRRDDVLNSVIFIMNMTGSDSKNYQMICLPIEYLNGWLFGIDINRCKPEIRDTLIKYKKECYQALHDYWFNGKAERKTTVDDRTGLRNAVSFLVNKKGLIYSEVYQLIHQQFGVEHIDELSQEQLSQAIKYIHFLTLNLDGLFKKGEEVIIPEYIFDAIMKHAKLAQKLAEKVIYYQEKQFALLGIARHYRSNELTSRANSLLSEFSYFLHEGEKLLAQQIENPSLTQIKNIF
ncbi:TPA: phage antirepressor N-terminal domain-containing protein [Haemophilus influenzae]|uniref:phage antirepressor N-terminal domain-containing protein n=1 Tax=Haemophilus influenzae TaxID=727 RepID=UPI001CC4B14C|nr:phage antirepressor N-terminal domain-containing protein [Haemophilus influenzae]